MAVCFMSEQEIRELFSDEAYVSSLLALETAEEVQASLAEKGIDLSEAEITKLLETIQNYVQSGEELSEADLEAVTGGVIGAIIAILVLGGLALGTAIGSSVKIFTGRRW
jgi:hypothetical protein